MYQKSGFQPSCEVTDPEFLFGHNQSDELLDQLITQLRLGTNTQLIGERRSGKTSVLKCCMSRFGAMNPNLIPVYLNFRDHHLIKGYSDAHRLLLAHLHATIVSRGFFEASKELKIRGVTLSKSPVPQEHFEILYSIADYQIDGLITDYFHILDENQLGIVLMIDEYEHLMRYTYGGQEGAFSFLRTLSSEPPSRRDSPKPLTYIIAGAMPWDRLCNLIGSPELNNIGAVFYIRPLDFDPFQLMWNHCLTESTQSERERVATSNIVMSEIYELSGGWPFYTKIIGHHLSVGNYDQNIFYEVLLQHFGVIWSRLTLVEQKQLIMAEKDLNQPIDNSIQGLIRRGLLKIDHKGNPIPCGRLWFQYIQEQHSEIYEDPINEKNKFHETPEEKLRLMVDDVAVLIAEVNETNLNKYGTEIFVSSNQDAWTYIDLRSPSYESSQFTHFTLSIYNLIFERTTGPKLVKVASPKNTSVNQVERFRTLERLPKKFRRGRTIVRVVDTLRHHFGKGHLTRLDSFNVSASGMPISNVLDRYLGSKAHPRDDQFLNFQILIVEDLIRYLEELRDYLSEEAAN